ncbi:MAG: hypothetical protein PVG30_09385 [Gammaproteobacteria bacterium]|jgi:hypothetical protein
MFTTIKIININDHPSSICNIKNIRSIDFDNSDISSINFGDMGGSALILLNILITCGIIKMIPDRYKKFAKQYNQAKGKYTTEDGAFRKQTNSTMDMKGEGNQLINTITISEKTKEKRYSLRFLGGLLTGNITHNNFIANILKKLDENGIKYTVIFNKNDLKSSRKYFDGSCQDVKIKQNIKDYIFKKCKLIDYEIDSKNKIITLYTPAPANLEKIEKLALKFITDNEIKIGKTNNGLEEFKKIIDEINGDFSSYFGSKGLFNEYINPLLEKIKHYSAESPGLLPYLFANNSIGLEHFNENYEYDGYKIKYVFSKRIPKEYSIPSKMVNLYGDGNKDCNNKKKKKRSKRNSRELKTYISHIQRPQKKNANMPVRPFFKPKKQIPPKHKKETLCDIIKQEMLGLFYQLVPQFLLNLFGCGRQKESGQKNRSLYEQIADCYRYK